jgi:hypothetical protein
MSHALMADRLTRQTEAAKMKHSLHLQKLEAEQRAKEIEFQRESQASAQQAQREMQGQELMQRSAFAYEREEADTQRQERMFEFEREQHDRRNQETEELIQRFGLGGEGEEGGGDLIEELVQKRNETELEFFNKLQGAVGDQRMVVGAMGDLARTTSGLIGEIEVADAFGSEAANLALEMFSDTAFLSALLTEGGAAPRTWGFLGGGSTARSLEDPDAKRRLEGAVGQQNLAGTFANFSQSLVDRGMGSYGPDGGFVLNPDVNPGQMLSVLREHGEAFAPENRPGWWSRAWTGFWVNQNFGEMGKEMNPRHGAALLSAALVDNLSQVTGEQFNLGRFNDDMMTVVGGVLAREVSLDQAREAIQKMMQDVESGPTAVMAISAGMQSLHQGLVAVSRLGGENMRTITQQIEEQTGEKVDGELVRRMGRYFGEMGRSVQQFLGLLNEKKK